jgi:hypothetical protein
VKSIVNPNDVRRIAREVTDQATGYEVEILDGICNLLAAFIGDAALASVNEALAKVNRRKLALEDVAKIGYVHARSIRENDGRSPVVRIEQYCAKSGDEYDRTHIRVATSLLVQCEFVTLIAAEDRSAKDRMQRCRRYALAPEAAKLFESSAPTHKH